MIDSEFKTSLEWREESNYPNIEYYKVEPTKYEWGSEEPDSSTGATGPIAGTARMPTNGEGKGWNSYPKVSSYWLDSTQVSSYWLDSTQRNSTEQRT